LNLDANPSASGDEYAGVSAAEHLRLLQKFAPSLTLDFALADQSIVASIEQQSALSGIVKDMSGELVVADLATAPGSNHHDPRKLISAFRNIFAGEVIR
jgi:hypothetical protein